MSISETQFQTWSNSGSEVNAQQTYSTIRLALENIQSRAGGRKVEIYLQGSYRNSTNIYGDSDVDIVCELPDIAEVNLSRLSQSDAASVSRARSSSSYSFAEFRRAVLDGLRDRFGASVTSRNKCIEIAAGGGRLQADVIPCLDYKLYQSLYTSIDGIVFYDQRDNRRIINYPKLHIDHGWAKNSAPRANGSYKPLIRIFKNWRNKLQADKKLRTDAPSYFIECLLYNVPDEMFEHNTYRGTVLAILQYLQSANLSEFWCQNEMLALCGATPEQWTVDAARSFINACIASWNQ